MGKETLVFVQAYGIELPKKNTMQNLGHIYILKLSVIYLKLKCN